MLVQSHPEHINLFRSLFKGREDVFAVRWEKGNKLGYMPAAFYDPYRFRAHKRRQTHNAAPTPEKRKGKRRAKSEERNVVVSSE